MNKQNCNYCNRILANKFTLKRHLETCSEYEKVLNDKKEEELREKYSKDVKEEYELKLKKQEDRYLELEKKYNNRHIEIAELNIAIKILKEQANKPQIINNNQIISNSNNTISSTNNSVFNLLKPINHVIENGMATINSDFVYKGVNGITSHIENETDILNNLFNSNKQRGTITYRKIDNPKLIKDERATELANDIVKSIPLEKFDENKLKNRGILHRDFMELKSGNTEGVKKGISKFIVDKSRTEEGIKTLNIDLTPFKNEVSDGLALYVFNHNTDPIHPLYFGIDSIICFLLKNDCINQNIEPVKIFHEIFHSCMCNHKKIYELLYMKELQHLGPNHDYYEITRDSYEKIRQFIDNSLDISHDITRIFHDFKNMNRYD